ncbi:MAG TPA: PQQ-binding-like beta-propeller repeat protein [Methanoregula sp.]|nr:PQQ-binding-like beta-propeller repeat protein [Methanoregula sp.]
MVRINRLFLIASVCFVVFLIHPVFAIEPAWNYSEPNADIGSVAVSSDGSSIAVAAGRIWLFSNDGRLLAKEPYGNLLAMTPNGSALATSYFSTVYLFKNNTEKTDTAPMKKVWETSIVNNVISLDISDDGSTIAMSTDGAGLLIYAADGSVLEYNKSHYSVVGVSANGKYVAGLSQFGLTSFSGSKKYGNKSYDLSLGSMPDFMVLPSKGDYCVFNDDQRILRVRSNGTEIWHARATGDVMSLAMTPDGKSIIIGTDNGHIDKFDDKGNLSWSYNTNPKNKNYASVPGVAVSDNGANIAAGTAGGEVLLLNSRGELQWSNQTDDHIHHIAMSAEGSVAVAAGEHTVYAFTAQSRNTAKTATVSKTNTPKITPVTPGITDTVSDTFEIDTVVSPTSTEDAVTTIVTSPPQQYSVIITEQSPPSPVVGLAALALAVLVFRGRRY